MTDGNESPTELGGLVRDGRVHRSVYIDAAIFAREMQQIFGRAWLYVGHESQIPALGDFIGATMGRQKVIVTRHRDGAIHVLFNRCRHRGAVLCPDDSGNAKRFVCCYHGWTYDTDGTLVDVPLPEGYPAGAPKSPAYDLARAPRVDSYRGFIFASLASDGPGLTDFLGPMTTSIDDLVDRSPTGDVVVAGGISKHAYNGNWKLVLENNNDLLHPRYVHASSIAAARAQQDVIEEGPGKIAMRQMLANGVPTPIWEGLGLWTSRYGHSFMGDFHNERLMPADANDPVQAEYRRLVESRVGEARAAEILAVSRFNSIIYPSLSFMSMFRQLRVIHPIAVDRTEIHSHTFRMIGAPDRMFRDSIAFANTVNGVGSLVLTDDLETYERVQHGLASRGNDWVDLARGLGGDVADAGGTRRGATGTSEIHVRNQFAAWRHYMTGQGA